MGALSNLLNPIKLKEFARLWINEDVPSFDIQGFIVGDKTVSANIYCKQPGVLAGFPFVDAIFEEIGVTKPDWKFEEGTFLQDASADNRVTIATVTGPAKKVLLAERTILNVLARCSGVSTQCHQIRSRLDQKGWNGELVGTRKTTPGFRMVEKYGLLVGNAGTHRYDMSSLVMLKDNHVTLSGQDQSMAQVIQNAKKYAGFHCKIEVECRNMEEAISAAKSGVDIIMLDNFESDDAIQSSCQLKSLYPKVLIEASGGITVDNVELYAGPHIDVISMSCLVQGYPIVDFSMKVQ